MSQHDYDLANQTRTAFRADLNDALAAIRTRNSGASSPSSTAVYMEWADTTDNLLKRRNAANSAWIVRDTLAETFIVARSSNTILGVSDRTRTFIATSTFTQTLTAAATLGDGWGCEYYNNGTGVITIDPNSSETINGSTTLELYPGEGGRLVTNGTAFYFLFSKATTSYKVVTTTKDVSVTGTQSITGVGFKPKWARINAAISGGKQVSWGFADGTTQTCLFMESSSGNFLTSSSILIAARTSSGVTESQAAFTSFDTDGMTVTWSKTGSPTGTMSLYCEFGR